MLLSGNSAALLNFVVQHENADVEAVWITQDKAARMRLHSEGKRAYHPWSPQGIWTCLRAGVFVYDVCGKDINYWLSRGSRNVLLRHGTGIKNIGRAIQNPKHHLNRLYHGSFLERLLFRFLLPWHLTTYDLVIASSPQHAAQAAEFFFVSKQNVAITGSPRNDMLFEAVSPEVDDPAVRWMRACREEGRKVCLYMPTFRDSGTPAFPFSWQDLDDICARQGVSVLIRLHPLERSEALIEEIARTRHLHLHDTKQDPALLFGDADCMITDYSSVVYDYMMLKKPVVFFRHDLANFVANSRDLYFDLEEISPGPSPTTLAELEDVLRDLSAGRLTQTALGAQYQDTLERFHRYLDGGSCERVWAEISQRFCPSAVSFAARVGVSGGKLSGHSFVHALSVSSVQRQVDETDLL